MVGFEPAGPAREASDSEPAAEDGPRATTLAPSSGAAARATERGASEELLPDFQSLLAGTLRNLAEVTRSTRVGAWARHPNGEAYVVAAAFREPPSPSAPDEASLEALEAVWDAGRPVDLGAEGPGTPLHALSLRHGFSAAAPLVSGDHERVAMLFVGGPMDPVGSVRPRTLAALEGAIGRLEGPAMAAAARARLSRLDDEICRLDRLASLGDLLAEVAHEIRNPLVSLKTFLQLLPEHLDDPEFHGDFREVVTGELQRMERLLNMLLGHARPTSKATRAEDAGASSRLDEVFGALQRLLDQRASEHEVALRAEVAPALPPVAIGEDSLRQIVLNLILNALEAAPAKSEILLRARPIAANRLELSVEDQGPGVPASLRTRLFEPFFSTRSGAGGLGLAISKKLVEDAGGSIRIEDGAKGGARFVVELLGVVEAG